MYRDMHHTETRHILMQIMFYIEILVDMYYNTVSPPFRVHVPSENISKGRERVIHVLGIKIQGLFLPFLSEKGCGPCDMRGGPDVELYLC